MKLPAQAPPDDGESDANLLARVASEVGCDSRLLRWQFVGSPRGPCRVWQVSGPGGAAGVVVKQFRSDRAFEQERQAYLRWLPRLPAATATLLTAHPAPIRALILGRVPGEPLATVAATAELERAAHRRAGEFLRLLHGLPEPDRDAMPLGEAVRRRIAAWLTRVRPAISGEQHALLAARAARSADPRLFAGARRAPCHRDFTASNWLVSGLEIDGKLGSLDDFFVIDFEHAHMDSPLIDLVKLWTEVWGQRPDLEAAFFAGYGRALTPDEQEQLGVLAAMHAMATIAWAHEHADPQFQALGQRALRRVLG